MSKGHHSVSPTVLLRISDGPCRIHRAFSDFDQAVRAAEAYAGAGFMVTMVSATGPIPDGVSSPAGRELPCEKTLPPGAVSPEKRGETGPERAKILEKTGKSSLFPEFLWMFSS